MRRMINTDNENFVVESRTYVQEITFKPRGLWWAIDDAWLDWCKSEMPQWIKPYNYELILKADVRLLTLRTEKELVQLSKDAGRPILSGSDHSYIDWPLLAAIYDGLEIPKYVWSCRLKPETFWYYGFDVACGCIWNLKKVESVVRCEDTVPKRVLGRRAMAEQ